MRILIAEDEFISRLVITEIMKDYGDYDIAVNGSEAIEAFKLSLESKKFYDLVCLDIMMPEKTGLEVLQEIREIEKENNIMGLDAVKVIMTTALADAKHVKKAFMNQCDSYIVKPYTKEKINEVLVDLELIK